MARAARRAARCWRAPRAWTPPRPSCSPRTREEVRAWQGAVFELVSQEAAGKRSTARIASLGVNGAGLVVMIAVFAHTGGLTGAEVAVAGGTSAVGQRVLEALLGDQAVRDARGEGARGPAGARRARCSAAEAVRYEALLAGAAPGSAGLGAARGRRRRARAGR